MQQTIYSIFYQFLASHQKAPPQNTQITAQRVANMLQQKIQQQFSQSSAFNNDYFKDNLNDVASTIMNVVYKTKQTYMNVKHLISYISIFQYILYSPDITIPRIITVKLNQFLQSFLALQNIENLNIIYEDSLNSKTISNFYQNIYLKSIENRYIMLMNKFGIIQKNTFLVSDLLKMMIQEKTNDLSVYDSKVTSDWIILSLVYYKLSVKFQPAKQLPVLSKILKRYIDSKLQSEATRQINGDQLCHFYNNIVLPRLSKIERKQIERIVQESTFDMFIIDDLISKFSAIFSQSNPKLKQYSS